MKWLAETTDPHTVSDLASDLGISVFLASLLVGRGIGGAEEAREFLDPKLAGFANPLTLPGIDKAAERICRAAADREKVVVYGDYDVDGVTSVSLVLSFFRDIGFSASYILPSRFTDGYGLNMARARQIAQEGYQLLITVDCGTTSIEEVEYLTSQGVDVIVTDHHRVHGPHPAAHSFINPDIWDGLDGYRDLAGVGVAFMLMMGVYIKLKEMPRFASRLQPLKSYLDIVTVGTVADMVPLTGLNRAMVVHGLNYLATHPPRPGIAALREVSGNLDKRLDTNSIAFYMAPRINAAGRLGNAEIGVDLLLSPSLSKAIKFAKRLDEDNKARRELERTIFEEADRALSAELEKKKLGVVVLGSPQWHKGVMGIVASRICEKYYRPTILMAIEDGVATGSGRSIEGFDLSAALEECSDLLERHGGHSMAAGLTMNIANLEALRKRLEEVLKRQMPAEKMTPTLNIDAMVELGDVDNKMIVDLERLAPYGMGNPEPVIGIRGLKVHSTRIVGGDHLKLMVEDQGRSLEAIGFRMADIELKAGDLVDVAFFPEIRAWQGQTYLQLRMKDVKPARPAADPGADQFH